MTLSKHRHNKQGGLIAALAISLAIAGSGCNNSEVSTAIVEEESRILASPIDYRGDVLALVTSYANMLTKILEGVTSISLDTFGPAEMQSHTTELEALVRQVKADVKKIQDKWSAGAPVRIGRSDCITELDESLEETFQYDDDFAQLVTGEVDVERWTNNKLSFIGCLDPDLVTDEYD